MVLPEIPLCPLCPRATCLAAGTKAEAGGKKTIRQSSGPSGNNQTGKSGMSSSPGNLYKVKALSMMVMHPFESVHPLQQIEIGNAFRCRILGTVKASLHFYS